MRVLAPLLTMVASLTTIFAAIVRTRWSKPRITNEEDYVLQPRAKPWLQTAAKWWLIIVVGGGTVILFLVVAVSIVQLSL